jgi:predicted transcriptional regulator
LLKTKSVAVTLAALSLIAIVTGCLAAQLYQQQNFKYAYVTQGKTRHIEVYSSVASFYAITISQYILPACPTALTLQTPNLSQTFLANITRSQIFAYINQNPGIQFRAIASALCLPLGLAEYHLGVLVKAGLVSFVRDGRYKRFFVSKRFSKLDMAAICLLRHKTVKRIIEVLLHKPSLSHGKLAGEVSITSQALTWQMKTLRSTQFVIQTNYGLRTFYSINEATEPLLEKYLAEIA